MTILNTGTSALLAFQRAMITVGHNVSNAATPGYSRQRVDLVARPGQNFGVGAIGQGVNIQALQRLADGLAFSRQIDSSGEMGRLQQLTESSLRLDRLMSDPGSGLAGPWADFHGAVGKVNAEPASPVARRAMIDAAQGLAQRFQSLDTQIQRMGSDNNNALTDRVSAANALARDIAQLNERIATTPGAASPDILDQRDRALDRLAKLVGVTTVEQDNGALNVFTSGGQPLVLDARASELGVETDPLRTDRMRLMLKTQAGSTPLPDHIATGEIGGLLEFRNNVLDPARAELGRLASGFALAFNRQQAAGVDYNGQPGQDLFRIPPPHTHPHAGNTGTGVELAASVADIGALEGHDLVLRFADGSWNARRADTGEDVAISGDGSADDPLMVGGLRIEVGGNAPAEGDRFLVQPTATAAAGLRLASTDPERIAAAQPLRMTQDSANLGQVRSASSAITNAGAFAGFAGASISFIDETTYSIDGGAPQTWVPGEAIEGDGWSLTLDGNPAAGDVFTLAATPPRSADNGNATALLGLDDKGLLNGGNLSLTGGMSQLTGRVGADAANARRAFEAQSTLHKQAVAQVDSAAGVNLDEEAVQLLRYQQAYMAAAQVISTADAMFKSLLGAVSR